MSTSESIQFENMTKKEIKAWLADHGVNVAMRARRTTMVRLAEEIAKDLNKPICRADGIIAKLKEIFGY